MSIFDRITQVLSSRSDRVELRAGSSTSLAKTEEHEPKRVSPKDLETIYIREGMIHKWINAYSEMVLSSNYRIVASNAREKKLTETFLENIGFRSLLRTTIRHMLIYGNAFWEIVWNDNKTKIVTIDWLDPKMMDVLRSSNGQIIYNEMGKPAAYVQYVGWNVSLDKVPRDRRVSQMPKFPSYQSGTGIKFERDEVVHFVFNNIGSSFWGVGLIEPIYNLILVKQNVEQGYAEAIQRTAFPRIWVKVGNDNYRPTQEQVDDVWQKLSNLEAKHQFVGPYYYEPMILEPRRTDKITVNLDYFIDQIVAGLGGPKPFITGSGEDTNRATLGDQKLFFERSLKEMQEELAENIRNNVFTLFAKVNKFSSVPYMVWDEISTESIDSKAERLVLYSKAGLLDPDDDLKKLIRRIEKLPTKTSMDGGSE